MKPGDVEEWNGYLVKMLESGVVIPIGQLELHCPHLNWDFRTLSCMDCGKTRELIEDEA